MKRVRDRRLLDKANIVTELYGISPFLYISGRYVAGEKAVEDGTDMRRLQSDQFFVRVPAKARQSRNNIRDWAAEVKKLCEPRGTRYVHSNPITY